MRYLSNLLFLCRFEACLYPCPIQVLTDHNLHPLHKEKLEDANLVLEGVNPSCGDDIILQLKVEDGVITGTMNYFVKGVVVA